MDTAVINVKVQPELKKKAQQVAEDMGLSLSIIIKRYLKQFIRTKTVEFSTSEEEPTEYMIQMLKESEKDIEAGRVSPTFTNADDAIGWLHDANPKYEYKAHQKVSKTVRKNKS